MSENTGGETTSILVGVTDTIFCRHCETRSTRYLLTQEGRKTLCAMCEQPIRLPGAAAEKPKRSGGLLARL